MVNLKFFYFLLLLFSSNVALAQNNYSITGTVKDNKGTLPGAGILVSGYKMSTVSNNDGKFALTNLAPGNYDILVQMIGYLPYKQNVIITNKSVSLDVVLKESTILLNEVVVKPDPDRAYHLSLFLGNFIGKSPNSKECKILNTQVLMTHFDKKVRVLTVSANEFLVIENKSLGYKIKYMLDFFEYDFKSKIIYFAGSPTFEDLKGGSAKQKKWAKAREVAYKGSYQHFYKSLYTNKLEQEGFVINKLAKMPNPFRQPDSLITANIKKLTTGQIGLTRVLTFNGGDSLSYWLKQKSEPKLVNTINRASVLADTLAKTFNNDIKSISFTDALYVIYKNELETEAYRNSGHWQSRPLDLPNYQISIINLMQNPAYVYANGGIYDPKSFLYEGFWAYEKMADMVPMDYLSSITIK